MKKQLAPNFVRGGNDIIHICLLARSTIKLASELTCFWWLRTKLKCYQIWQGPSHKQLKFTGASWDDGYLWWLFRFISGVLNETQTLPREHPGLGGELPYVIYYLKDQGFFMIPFKKREISRSWPFEHSGIAHSLQLHCLESKLTTNYLNGQPGSIHQRSCRNPAPLGVQMNPNPSAIENLPS